MKAPDFQYERPTTLAEAYAFLADEDLDASPLAGGQSLVPMMNFRMAQPSTLVDLGALDELRGISEDGDGLRIGAMTRYVELMGSTLVADRAPLIQMALPHVAHAAIRNRGTIGGSIALCDPAAEMPAVLLALDATIELGSADGARSVDASDFFVGMFQTEIEEGELVTAITIPPRSKGRRFGFYELARRHGDYAIVGAAISATGSDEGIMTDWRLAFFGASDCPLRATDAEAILEGTQIGDEQALISAKHALGSIDFNNDLNASAKTRQHLAGVVLARALEGV